MLAVCHRSHINGEKNVFFCLDLEFLFESRRDDSEVSPCLQNICSKLYKATESEKAIKID